MINHNKRFVLLIIVASMQQFDRVQIIDSEYVQSQEFKQEEDLDRSYSRFAIFLATKRDDDRYHMTCLRFRAQAYSFFSFLESWYRSRIDVTDASD